MDYSAIENGIHTYPVSYRLVIQGRGRIFFPDYKAKAYLNPVERTLFYLFLNHPEGIASDDLVLHWKELCRIYSRESSFADSNFREDKIESLCAESKTVFYATVSRIKRKFRDVLGDQNAESDYSNNEQYHEDLKAPLMALEKHVIAVVDWICEAPEEYNAYVERYLPYHKRSGDIPRKVLYGIDPGWHDSKDDERLIRGLEAVKASEPSKYDKITLRVYISIWSAAFRVFAKIRGEGNGDRYDKQRLNDAKTMTDVELFKRYDSKGKQIEGLDLDSDEAYEVWYGGNSAYHCMDVTYARIHLAPWRKEDSEPYRFHLYFGVYGYYDDVAEIAIALHEQGITLVVDEIDSILKILRQEDMVGFRPWPDKYMGRDGVTNQMWLPYIGEVSRDVYWKILKNTTWHKQKEAWPNE